MAVSEDNPFRLPPDDEIFLIRDQERKRREKERERVKTLRVWEKSTASSTVSASVRRSRRVDDSDDAQLADMVAKQTRGARTESIGRDPRREKENVTKFVAKKREMFLVQMSLDVKKAEILKLDEKSKQKEEALQKSQVMLDEDVTRFDAFLQSNDQKAHKAMKDAEDMTKKKQERLHRIKTLKTALSTIQSEIAKHREQKEECMKYKEFLVEKLTPLEWKEEKKREKIERKKLRKKVWVEDRMAELARRMQEEIDQAEKALEERQKSEKPKARSEEAKEAREREKEMEMHRRRIRRKYPTGEALEQEYVDESSDEEMPLYFQEPRQLLEIFTALEASNLFLIQNSQDTEQALDELQQKFAEVRRSSDATAEARQQNIKHLEHQIQQERMKCEALKETLSLKRGASEQETLLAEMAEKVAEVHVACGHTSETDADTLKMLGNIEGNLEDWLLELDEFEETGFATQVKMLENAKEKQRRDEFRRQRKQQSDRKIEERLKASLIRSQAPIHKKVGKQIMFRSMPLFQAKRVVQEDDGVEEAIKDHELFGIWINKEGIPKDKPPELSVDQHGRHIGQTMRGP
mmetsp:Transcript_65699/g.182882  ORF Transcript_65699/g.182882 Transcript_65699/m.182882 type:complete len:579 (-) Transcript_65699:193-1929(-)